MIKRLKNIKAKPLIILAAILEFLALGLIIYLVILPLYPTIQYKIDKSRNADIDYTDINAIQKITGRITGLPAGADKDASGQNGGGNIAEAAGGKKEGSGSVPVKTRENKSSKKVAVKTRNTLIIPKIGVNIPIIESKDPKYGLNHGAWRLPKSSTPEKNGNMILTGHRFKYLPPSNLTFYLLDKMEAGDIISVVWNNKTYYYRVKEKKIVKADDLSILKQTKTPTLTIYTCDPIYSTKNRLVIVAEQITNP